MSIGTTVKTMWATAPAWRGLVIVSGVVTCLAAAATFVGGGAGGPPGGGQAASGTAATAVGSSASGAGGTAGAAAGQAAAPVIPQGGTVVVMAPPPESEGRWNRFVSVVAAADKELRSGQRCVRMKGALPGLEPPDHQYMGQDAARSDAYQKAVQCEADLADSDRRLDALSTAHEAARQDGSADRIVQLARTKAALLPFDTTRDLPAEALAAIEAGAEAESRLAGSDQRIATLDQTAPLAQSGQAKDLENFARAAEAITAFDKGRMTAAQLAVLERGQDASVEIQASDRRIEDLVAALKSGAGSDPDGQRALIDAVAALTPLDAARATADDAAAIAEARATAARLAVDRLAGAATAYDPATAGYADSERLAGLRAIIQANGGVQNPTPEQQAALAKAEQAVGRIEASNRRLRALVDAAASWTRNPDPTLGRTIEETFRAVDNPFDAARLDGEFRKAHNVVAGAYAVIKAKDTGLTVDNRGAVPIHVAGDSPVPALDLLRSRLQAGGYLVVDSREAAAMAIDLSLSPPQAGTFQQGSVRLQTAKTVFDIDVRWIFDDKPFVSGSSRGGGASRSLEEALDKAISQGVEAAFEVFDAEVRKQGPAR